ncbi:MAG: adenosylhomocysteinase, partial [Chloroflexota bacterium]
ALDLALEAAGYDDLRAQQRSRRSDPTARKALGIGLSVYVEITGGGPSEEYGSIEIRPDGSVLAKTGTSPHGQGHVTSWAMLISARTGIPIERIDVIHGDTDVVPQGGMTGGSRSLQVGGVAMHQAAGEAVERSRSLAADLLEANVDDIVLDTDGGRFHVAGTPAVSKSWSDVAASAGEGGLVVEHVFNSVGATYPSGAHVAVVEVDPVRALEALMDGYSVMTAGEAAAWGDLFITATGNVNVFRREHFEAMRDGAIMANSGHFDAELDLTALRALAEGHVREVRDNVTEFDLGGKKLNLVAEGRLVNLGAAEGHPAAVMDMSFANQALSAEYVARHHAELEPRVYVVPEAIDAEVARLKLAALGIILEPMTPEQIEYVASWQHGT